MTTVSKFYNPFRDDKKNKEAKKDDSFSDFDFPLSNDPFGDTEKDPFRSTPQEADFDPFQIETAEIEQKGSTVSSSSKDKLNHSNASGRGNATSRALKPKLVVKLSIREEVTSRVKMALDEFDSTSDVTVEGTIYAQVQCSDAKKNAPFAILVPHVPGFDHTFSLRPNDKYAVAKSNVEGQNAPILVTVPKQEVVAVPVARYTLQKEIKFMPVLVERKITRSGNRVRIAIQVRSRLDNISDMKEMTILVAVPEKIDGNTVSIERGNGSWDALKRTIKWKMPNLPKGQSELVIAEADLWDKPEPGDDETPFPTMFRCTSVADPITSMEWKVAQVSSSPSHLTVPSVEHSFRLLHRLP